MTELHTVAKQLCERDGGRAAECSSDNARARESHSTDACNTTEERDMEERTHLLIGDGGLDGLARRVDCEALCDERHAALDQPLESVLDGRGQHVHHRVLRQATRVGVDEVQHRQEHLRMHAQSAARVNTTRTEVITPRTQRAQHV